MPNAQFFPSGDAELVQWYNNFKTKLPIYAASVGITDDELDAVVADYAMLAFCIGQVVIFAQEAKERVAYKDTFKNGPLGVAMPAVPVVPTVPPPVELPPPGILPRLRAVVKRIKAAPRYTDAMGRDLGIIAPAPAPVTAKPAGGVTAVSGSVVQIKFVKNGFPGVSIESRRGSETAWTSLGIAITSPFADTRPPLVVGAPEVRTYRMRYVRANLAVGQDSDTLTVTTIP